MDPLTAYAIAQGAGSAIDLAGDMFGGAAKRRRIRDAKNSLLAGVNKARDLYGDYDSDTGVGTGTYGTSMALYDPYRDAGLDAQNKMLQLENDYKPEDYAYDKFEYGGFGKGVQDYLDPSMDYQQQRMLDATQGSAAAAGGLLSGKTLKDLQSNASNLAQTDYANAFNRMNTDRSFDYQDYLNKFEASKAAVDSRYARFRDKMNRLSGTNTLGYNASGAQSGLTTGYGTNMAKLAADEANIKAKAQMNTGSWQEDLIGGLGGVVKAGGNIYGALNQPTQYTPEQLAAAGNIGAGAASGGVMPAGGAMPLPYNPASVGYAGAPSNNLRLNL